tara:strand:+ start:92 stop:787 length:696 start_codon:yes stop_codon:yes gene_type:complete
MKSIAITQSNYIPWKGYFDLIAHVDEFVLYDDAQYTRRDWRNRNKIKTPIGLKWLTVPVESKGNYGQQIKETRISGSDWAKSHWQLLNQNYRKSPFFQDIENWLRPIYFDQRYILLSQLNKRLIEGVCDYLGIDTMISSSSDYDLRGSASDKLAGICEQAHADLYVTGPAAKDYVVEDSFLKKKVEIAWFDYDGYPEYDQLWGAFEHRVTILDLLFNCGKKSPNFMRYVAT